MIWQTTTEAKEDPSTGPILGDGRLSRVCDNLEEGLNSLEQFLDILERVVRRFCAHYPKDPQDFPEVSDQLSTQLDQQAQCWWALLCRYEELLNAFDRAIDGEEHVSLSLPDAPDNPAADPSADKETRSIVDVKNDLGMLNKCLEKANAALDRMIGGLQSCDGDKEILAQTGNDPAGGIIPGLEWLAGSLAEQVEYSWEMLKTLDDLI